LVSDIPAGDGNISNHIFTVYGASSQLNLINLEDNNGESLIIQAGHWVVLAGWRMLPRQDLVRNKTKIKDS
jgi:hypothetical protein